MPRPRRSFPLTSKPGRCSTLTGDATPAELCRKHNIKPQLLSHWKATVLERMPSLFQERSYQHASTSRCRTRTNVGRSLRIEILRKLRMLPGLSNATELVMKLAKTIRSASSVGCSMVSRSTLYYALNGARRRGMLKVVLLDLAGQWPTTAIAVSPP